MKLLNCIECHDIFALSVKPRSCHCGASSGHYFSPMNPDVEVEGPCRVIGMRNDQYVEYFKNPNPHTNYNWFFIAENKSKNKTLIKGRR